MSDQLRGKTAVITGASRGIGAAVAQRFASEGANLAISARTLDNHATLSGSLNETADLCRQYGGHVEVIQADLADEKSRATIIPKAIEALGSVNILINNAAAAIYKNLDAYTLKHRRLMTTSSRMESIGGLVTCANNCLK